MKHFLFLNIWLVSLASLISLTTLTACSPESPMVDGYRPLPRPAPTPLPVFEKVQQPPKAELPTFEKVIQPAQAPLPTFPKVLQPKQPDLQKFPQVNRDNIQWITMDGGQDQLSLKPKLDILFVEDNSGSMANKQVNLERNITHFAEAFQKNAVIDYHIGLVGVWDSQDKFVNAKTRVYDNGELRRVTIGGVKREQRFLTRETATPQALASSLIIGVASAKEVSPEFEETFSPITSALRLGGRGDKNEGFFRPDAHLVVVIVTDADDSASSITPQQVAQQLIDFKGGRTSLVSVYGVLVKKADPDEVKDFDLQRHPNYHRECFDYTKGKPVLNGQCPVGFGPERIEQLIVEANPDDGTPAQIRSKYIMGIVQKDFGSDLSRISSQIATKTLQKEILLDQRPRTSDKNELMLRVKYGAQEIPQSKSGGWTYNPETNSVHLAGDIVYKNQPGAHFVIELVPVIVNGAGAPEAVK